MRTMNMKKAISKTQLLLATAVVAMALLLTAPAYAATPGITGTTFNLTAQSAFLSQPDGQSVYSWGYGCATGFVPAFAPAAFSTGSCSSMQVPGPTMIVQAPATVTVTLANNLPTAAGNTSILFPGFQVATSGGVVGLLTQEAVHGGSVAYTLTIPSTAAGTHAYYSGTQGDLQVEMGLYGAIIVLPSAVPIACTQGNHSSNLAAQAHWSETNYRLAAAAYNHAGACYDREYIFQFSEIDPRIHRQAEEQSTRACPTGCMNVATSRAGPGGLFFRLAVNPGIDLRELEDVFPVIAGSCVVVG